MFVWISSYPRSGNSLSMAALGGAWGLPVNSVFARSESEIRAGKQPSELPRNAAIIDELRQREGISLLKTHLVLHADTPEPAIHLVRDGRDAIVSYAHLSHSIGDARLPLDSVESTMLALVDDGDHPFGDWTTAIHAWTERDAPTEIVRFEDLRERAIEVLGRAAENLGLGLDEPTWAGNPDIGLMRDISLPGLVRSGKVGGWREEMSEQVIERFAARHGETLVELGYEQSADPSDWGI